MTRRLALQACVLGVALGTGLAGAIVGLGEALSWRLASALGLAYLVTGVMAAAASVVAVRLPAVRRDSRHVAAEVV